MPSYVITGTSRGLGFEQVRQLSSDANNKVIGLARDKAATQKKVLEELGELSNVHILYGDMDSYDSLKKAAADTAAITGGSLDYLIANAGIASKWDAYSPIGVLGQDPEKLEQEYVQLHKTNVIGNIHLYNLFMPQILKGKDKKVIAISSGLSDFDIVRSMELDLSPLYAISKAALNMVTAKFSSQYKQDGVLFLSICPGMVDVGQFTGATEEQMKGIKRMVEKFVEYAPHFTGPATPAEAMKDVIGVYHKASIEKGDAGEFVSHLGNKEWL